MKFESPERAYYWARKHGPSDESRQFASKEPEYAYRYARYVDESPRDDTREAVLSDPGWAYSYALDIDESPRDDTRRAVLSSPQYSYLYTMYIDNDVVHPEVVKAIRPFLLLGNEWAIKFFKKYGDGK